MRHRVAGRKLSRTREHRLALRRNLVASLFEHETISTTIQKAKEVKPMAEKLITLAKKGKLQHRRLAIQMLGNRKIVAQEEGAEQQHKSVVGKLFSEIGPRYLERPGGYTRIIRLPLRRLGDNGELVLLQLVGQDDTRDKKSKPRKTTVVEDTPAVKVKAAAPEAEVVVEETPASDADAEEETKEQ